MSRSESAKLYQEIFCLSKKEQEHSQSGSESIAKCDRWICLWTLEEVEIHRRTNCISYDKCLNYCCLQAWEGFTCSMCESYEERKEKNEDYLL